MRERNNQVGATVLSEDDFTADIPFDEADRRRLVLKEIASRVSENGPHVAMPDPKRATQFMPFDALTGFGKLMEEAEKESSKPRDFAGPEVFNTP